MPSTATRDRPRAALAVAGRYRRLERPLSALVSALAVAGFLATYLATSLLPAVGVAALLVVLARAPLFRPEGSYRLETEADPGAVVEAFAGPAPPVLPFQWGLADEVTTDDGTVTYRIPYLFGLRAVETVVRSRTERTGRGADGDRRVTLTVEANGGPWATYAATIARRDGRTVVDVTYAADRRFGLRRVPQRLVAARYRDAALAAQGYTVVERGT